MCKCTPNIRTPWCGKLGCEIPKQTYRPTPKRLRVVESLHSFPISVHERPSLDIRSILERGIAEDIGQKLLEDGSIQLSAMLDDHRAKEVTMTGRVIVFI